MRRTTPLLVVLTFSLAAPSAGQGLDDVEIVTHRLTDGVYMLVGQGGNIGVSVGDDGVFVIDDQFAPLTDKILAAIAAITSESVRFVFNTHWHGDHTGGNENMGRAGALIVAHDNVYERMSTEQVLERIGRPPSTEAASAEGALPVVTFTEDVTFHINDDVLHAFHVQNAHTDGDAIVHFVVRTCWSALSHCPESTAFRASAMAAVKRSSSSSLCAWAFSEAAFGSSGSIVSTALMWASARS